MVYSYRFEIHPSINKDKSDLDDMDVQVIETWTFRMQSERATTALNALARSWNSNYHHMHEYRLQYFLRSIRYTLDKGME